jgi:hypothetical protein
MLQRWLMGWVWIIVWSLVFFWVRWWGMYWAFGAAGALTTAIGLTVWRTLALLFGPRHAYRHALPARRPQRVRRIIIEEECWR